MSTTDATQELASLRLIGAMKQTALEDVNYDRAAECRDAEMEIRELREQITDLQAQLAQAKEKAAFVNRIDRMLSSGWTIQQRPNGVWVRKGGREGFGFTLIDAIKDVAEKGGGE